MNHFYHIFDITLKSDFPLPELPEAESSDEVISVRLDGLKGFDVSRFEQTFQWVDKKGHVVCRVKRLGDEYLYIFDGLAQFHITNEAKFDIAADEDISISSITGTAAMMEMINCAFSLDPSDKQSAKSNFLNIGQAITSGPGLYNLRYPRDHARLAEVREVVEACVGVGLGK